MTVPIKSLRGLGDSNTKSNFINTASSITALAQNLTSKLGAKPTNKTLNELSSVAAQVSSLGIPGVSEVAGIVSQAAQVLSSVFAGGPSSAEMLQQTAGQNAALLVQIDAIDKQTDAVMQGLVQLKQALNKNGFKGLNGLGAWYNEVAASTINQSITPALQDQLAQKGKNLQALIEIFNSTITDTYNAIYTKKNGHSYVLIGLVFLTLGGLTYLAVSEFTNKDND